MAKIELADGSVARVDDSDVELVSRHKWCTTRIGELVYAMTKVDGKTVYMHRLIAGPEKGQNVDHANHDALDNRRDNLRLCNQSENLANSRRQKHATGFRGVYKHGARWRVICGRNENGRNNYVGSFKSEREAALAYDVAAKARWGEFASLNF